MEMFFLVIFFFLMFGFCDFFSCFLDSLVIILIVSCVSVLIYELRLNVSLVIYFFDRFMFMFGMLLFLFRWFFGGMFM